MELDPLKFPIGAFNPPEVISKEQLTEAIRVLEVFPQQLHHLVDGLPEDVLDQPYRPGGWTMRQLVHHISDSHHHCYNRIRWTLTEDTPTIKAYDQDAFASLSDYTEAPIAWSLAHLEALHQKIVYILQNLTDAQWERSFVHPGTGKKLSMKVLALMYAWHSQHHFAHLENALDA